MDVLACAYLRMAEELDAEEAAADEEADGDDDAANATPYERLARCLKLNSPEEIEQRLTHERSELLRRADYFNAVARELAPGDAFASEVAGLIALRREDFTAAKAHFERALERAPERYLGVAGLAVTRRAEGDLKGAEALYEKLCERYAPDKDVWADLGAFLIDSERYVDAAKAYARALKTLPADDRATFLRSMWDALARTTSDDDEIAGRILELVEPLAGDSRLMWDVSSLFVGEDEEGCAIQALYRAHAAKPDDPNVLGQLGRLLADSIPTRAEGMQMLERAMEIAPAWGTPRRSLAMRLMADDPGRALELVRALLREETMWTYELESFALARLGRAAESEKALRRAAAASEVEPWKALSDIVHWHTEALQFERAIHVANVLLAQEMPDAARLEVLSKCAWPFRWAGKIDTIAPALREACKDGVPEVLAWETYWSFEDKDPKLASAAATVLRSMHEGDDDAATWRVREAVLTARLGDDRPLVAAFEDESLEGEALCQLAQSFAKLGRFDDAASVASRAYRADPLCSWAVVEHMLALERGGRVEDALALMQDLRKKKPYDHTGPERAALILAKLGRSEEASTRRTRRSPSRHAARSPRWRGPRRSWRWGLRAGSPASPRGDAEDLRVAVRGDGALCRRLRGALCIAGTSLRRLQSPRSRLRALDRASSRHRTWRRRELTRLLGVPTRP